MILVSPYPHFTPRYNIDAKDIETFFKYNNAVVITTRDGVCHVHDYPSANLLCDLIREDYPGTKFSVSNGLYTVHHV